MIKPIITKRPKWARYKRCKVVTKHFMSAYYPWQRTNEEGKSHGRMLTYNPGSVVVSPNGVCKHNSHKCCRGIHAYSVIRAKDYVLHPDIILNVYAAKWYGGREKDKWRAHRVWVGQVNHAQI